MALTITGTTAQSAVAATSLGHSPTVLVGDLFICHIHLGTNGVAVTAPAGWTAITNNPALPEAGAQGAVFYKEMSAVDSTPMTFSFSSSTYASVMTRVTSNIRGNKVKMIQHSPGSTATDNLASYTTPSITATAPNLICYGVGSEGAGAITYSATTGTEVTEIGNTDVSPERVAMYTHADQTGSISKTMTPSTANQFGAVYFIAEVREVPTTVIRAGELKPAVSRAARW